MKYFKLFVFGSIFRRRRKGRGAKSLINLFIATDKKIKLCKEGKKHVIQVRQKFNLISFIIKRRRFFMILLFL